MERRIEKGVEEGKDGGEEKRKEEGSKEEEGVHCAQGLNSSLRFAIAWTIVFFSPGSVMLPNLLALRQICEECIKARKRKFCSLDFVYVNIGHL